MTNYPVSGKLVDVAMPAEGPVFFHNLNDSKFFFFNQENLIRPRRKNQARQSVAGPGPCSTRWVVLFRGS